MSAEPEIRVHPLGQLPPGREEEALELARRMAAEAHAHGCLEPPPIHDTSLPVLRGLWTPFGWFELEIGGAGED